MKSEDLKFKGGRKRKFFNTGKQRTHLSHKFFLVWQGEETKEEVRDVEKTTNKGHRFHKVHWKFGEGRDRSHTIQYSMACGLKWLYMDDPGGFGNV